MRSVSLRGGSLTRAEIEKLLAGSAFWLAQPDRHKWKRMRVFAALRQTLPRRRRRPMDQALSRDSPRPVASGQHLSAITKHDHVDREILRTLVDD